MIVFLTGFMCSGKTTDGKAAAEMLRLPFLDLDQELEKQTGLTIPSFIAKEGMPAFRQKESEILLQTYQLLHLNDNNTSNLPDVPEAIVATGGGCILVKENRDYLMQARHSVIWIGLPFTLLLTRIKTNPRPLLIGLTDVEIMHFYTERLPLYQKIATHTITSPPVPEQIVRLLELTQ